MKHFMIILSLFMFVSCGILKDTQRTKTKSKSEIKERGVRIINVPKDSIVFIPNVIVKPHDTTITVENKSIILKTTYRNRRVKKIKAIQKPKQEINPYERTEVKTEKVKDSKSKGLLQPEYFLYIFAGLIIMIIANNLTKKTS